MAIADRHCPADSGTVNGNDSRLAKVRVQATTRSTPIVVPRWPVAGVAPSQLFGRMALLVDEVADVETFPTAALQTLPANFSLENAHVFEGLIQKPKGLLLVLEASELPKLGLVYR